MLVWIIGAKVNFRSLVSFWKLKLKAEGFQDLMKGWWQEVSIKGTTSYILSRKLKEVKARLRVWNNECFGRLETNKKLALSQVEAFDTMREERNLTLTDMSRDKAPGPGDFTLAF